MKKVEWSQGKTRITDEEALRYKNFDKVVEQSATTGNKSFGKWGLAAGSALIVLLLGWFSWPNMNPVEPLYNAAYDAQYASPMQEVDVPTEVLTENIKADEATTIVTEHGTEFRIAANALLDENRKPVSGPVEFRYREFLDQKDVMLSGIPMTYDTAGVVHNFESAGMFELLAFQDNKPLFIAQDKPIEVAFQTKATGNYFNLYQLDAETNKWAFKRKDRSGFSPEEIAAADEAVKQSPTYRALDSMSVRQAKLEAEVRKSKPMKPRKADADATRFSIRVSYEEFPELEAFDNLKFEVGKDETRFKPEYASEQWDKVIVQQAKDRQFEVCFTNKAQGEVCFFAVPVVPAADFKGAMKHYDALMTAYKEKRKAIKEEKRQLRKKMATLTAELEREKTAILLSQSGVRSSEVQNSVTRNFMMSEFGVWNCDYPRVITNPRVLAVSFVDDAGKRLAYDKIYLVDRLSNVVVSYNGKKPSITYDSKDENMLWAVSNDGLSVSFVSAANLQMVPADKKEHAFRASRITAKTFSEMSAEEILNL